MPLGQLGEEVGQGTEAAWIIKEKLLIKSGLMFLRDLILPSVTDISFLLITCISLTSHILFALAIHDSLLRCFRRGVCAGSESISA